MEVEYVLTPEDHIAFNIHRVERLPWQHRHPQWSLLLVTLLGCLGVGASSVLDPLWSVSPGLGRVLLIVVGLGFSTAMIRSMVQWRQNLAQKVRNLFNDPRNTKVLGWCRFAITPEALTSTVPDSSATIKWSGICGIHSTEEHAFFYTTASNGYILPRQPFPSEEEFRNFVETARRYWKAARKVGAAQIVAERQQPVEQDTGITSERRTDH
jgi:hypothetical protein